ncbi:hypothetical protein J3E64_000093 [Sphingobium sp. OAS761]|uniref:trypco2 family protein n=1 Tax=Sphingobium sp. OAS761 TaxID=2817901 RepID=UPI00209E0DC0|nr:trypco2 family protein [Sphingobium sp. OAS761]MCP1468426.1 hypothetical protein [Sphingobium sp. OAS761]
MQVSLAEAIKQLRDELRESVLEAQGQDILFTPKEIEVELAITFGAEVKAGGSVKLFAFLDVSSEIKASDSHQHKIKLKLDVTDGAGNPIKVSSLVLPKGV